MLAPYGRVGGEHLSWSWPCLVWGVWCGCGGFTGMPMFRIRETAGLLGVSTDTLRRWADRGRIETITDSAGRQAVDGAALAGLAQDLADEASAVSIYLRRVPETVRSGPLLVPTPGTLVVTALAMTSARWWSPLRCATGSPGWSPALSATP